MLRRHEPFKEPWVQRQLPLLIKGQPCAIANCPHIIIVVGLIHCHGNSKGVQQGLVAQVTKEYASSRRQFLAACRQHAQQVIDARKVLYDRVHDDQIEAGLIKSLQFVRSHAMQRDTSLPDTSTGHLVPNLLECRR